VKPWHPPARPHALSREELGLVPLDQAAKSGRCLLVAGPEYYAIARWDASSEAWVFPGSGRPLDFEPTEYQPPRQPQ